LACAVNISYGQHQEQEAVIINIKNPERITITAGGKNIAAKKYLSIYAGTEINSGKQHDKPRYEER
jgi:hypothetical protein